MLEARLDRGAEVHVDVADPGHVVRTPDQRERVAGRLEALDPGVVEQRLHQDHAVGPARCDELRDRLRVGGGGGEQERVVARARRLRGAGHERLLDRQELPLRRRQEERDRVRGAARESAGGPVRPVVELLDRRQHALAHLWRHGPLAAQDVRDGAQRDPGALGDLRHRRRLRTVGLLRLCHRVVTILTLDRVAVDSRSASRSASIMSRKRRAFPKGQRLCVSSRPVYSHRALPGAIRVFWGLYRSASDASVSLLLQGERLGSTVSTFTAQQDGVHGARGRRGPPGRRVGGERRSCPRDPRDIRDRDAGQRPARRRESAGSRSRSATAGRGCATATSSSRCVDNDDDRFVPFPPLIRFLRADGTELLAESVPHFSAPPQRRYRRGGGDLFGCEATFDAYPAERFYGLGQHQHGLLTRRAPSSTSSSATPRSRCRSPSPAGATASSGTCRGSAASSWAPTARGGPRTQPGRSTTG